jgi:hypothetical protein
MLMKVLIAIIIAGSCHLKQMVTDMHKGHHFKPTTNWTAKTRITME